MQPVGESVQISAAILMLKSKQKEKSRTEHVKTPDGFCCEWKPLVVINELHAHLASVHACAVQFCCKIFRSAPAVVRKDYGRNETKNWAERKTLWARLCHKLWGDGGSLWTHWKEQNQHNILHFWRSSTPLKMYSKYNCE